MAKNEITFKIVEKLGEISRTEYDRKNWQTKEVEHVVETKELNRVSWNDKEPKTELRIWYTTDDVVTAGKGITLNEEEMMNLRMLLASMDETTEDTTEVESEEVAC